MHYLQHAVATPLVKTKHDQLGIGSVLALLTTMTPLIAIPHQNGKLCIMADCPVHANGIKCIARLLSFVVHTTVYNTSTILEGYFKKYIGNQNLQPFQIYFLFLFFKQKLYIYCIHST